MDGQFQRAGFADDKIIECHGSIHYLQCSRLCTNEVWGADQQAVAVDEEVFLASEPLPKCQKCSHVARPNILMFNDPFFLRERTEAQSARFKKWTGSIAKSKAKLVVVELGAGRVIPSVRIVSERLAKDARGVLIRINPTEWAVPSGHIGLPLGASEGVRRVC